MDSKTSQVILATGELCPQSELNPGMMLLGANSEYKMLMRLKTSSVPAFEVTQKRGVPFLVGFDQKICLASKAKESLTLNAGDYTEFSKTRQQDFSLQKAILEFPSADLPLDPYFFGLLLGDGSFRCVPIKLTTPDAEIIDVLYEIAARYQWPVSINHLKNNLSDSYCFKRAVASRHSLKEIIASLGLFNHKSNIKFIPKQYLCADRTTRQALLAGLLDTDGSLCNNHYDFATSSNQLANDVAFLARSLGFAVSENRHPKTRGCVARLYIHGDFSETPIRIKRKIAKPRHHLIPERFKIKPVGIQEIQYLDVDSYLLSDCTVRVGGAI
jgi:hypothetical protein